jgi:hypothetical protein
MGVSLGAIVYMLLSAIAGMQSDTVVIKRELRVNDESRYSVEGSLSQSVAFPNGTSQDMSTDMSAILDLKTGEELDDDKLPFTLNVTDLKLASSPPQQGDSKDRKVTLKGLVDEQNVMTDIGLQGLRKDDLAIAGLVSRMAQGIGTYPEAPVKVGDTWTVSEEETFHGNKKLEYTLRYTGQETVGGLTLYSISADSEIPVQVDSGAMEGDGDQQGMGMQGTVHVTVQALIDQNGLVNSMVFETKANMTVDSPDASGQIKLKSSETLKIVRQPLVKH